jgi:hypothetical protein
MKPKLAIVEESPTDISAELRAAIHKRDWAAVHIEADRRAPLFMLDRPKRTWRA